MPGLGLASANPFEKAGFVLESLSAGLQGRELPIHKYRREEQAQESHRLKQAADHMVVMTQARDVLQGLPEGQRGMVVQQLGQLLGEDALPFLEAVAAQDGSEIGDSDFQEALDMTGGDRKLAGKLLGQSSFRKSMQEARDTRQMGPVRAKAQSIIEKLGGGKPGSSGLPAISADALLAYSAALPDKDVMRFSDLESETLRRQWEALSGEMGLETPGVREFAQKEAIRHRNTMSEIGARKTEDDDEDEQGAAFGSSQQGLALDTMMQYKQALEAGAVPPELETKARVAAHILQQKKFLRTPEGDLLETTPGIPEGFPVPGAARNPQAAANPTAEQLGTGPTVAKAQVPRKDDNRVGLAMQAIDDAARLMDDASADDETITGALGQAKALGGGVARQVGVPVGDRSRQLRAKVEEVKALAAPAVLGEKGRALSDADRGRLDALVGNLDYTMDDLALRGALSEVLKLLEKTEGTSAGASAGGEPSAVNPETGERLVLRNGQWVPANGK